jgi:hypothetical protein
MADALKVQIPQAFRLYEGVSDYNDGDFHGCYLFDDWRFGLGSEVIMQSNRLEIGRGFSAGISVVILAVILDRITQGIYKQEDGEAGGKRKGYFKGRKISQTLRSK